MVKAEFIFNDMEPEWFEDHDMKGDWEYIISSALYINVDLFDINVTKNADKFVRFFRRLNSETSLIVLISTNEDSLMTIIDRLISNKFKISVNNRILTHWKFQSKNLTMELQTVKPMDGNQKSILIFLHENIRIL